MKKTIILLLLLYAATTVMAQNNNDSISFTNITTTDFMEAIGGGKISWSTMAKPKPKRIKCPKDVNDNCGGGFWNAIGNFFAGIGGAIWNGIRWAATSVASFFDGEGGGGGGGNWSLNPPHATWGNYNGGGTPPNFVPPGGSGGGGSATTNNTNPLGNTTIPPPVKPVVDDETEEDPSLVKKDTVQPVKVDCNDSEINRGSYCDAIMKYIDTTSYMKKLRDSSTNRTTEAGFSVRTIGVDTPYTYKAIDFVDTGQAQSVGLYIDNYTVATVHLHTHKLADGTIVIPSPSPRDYWGLISNAADISRKRRFQSLFTVYGGPNKDQFALMPTDTNTVQLYYNANPNLITQIIDTRDSIPDPNDASKNIRNPYYNNWMGDENDNKSYLGLFLLARDMLRKSNHPKEYLDTYASLIVAQNTGLPVKLLMRNAEGHFKELKFEEQGTGKNKKYIIKICK